MNDAGDPAESNDNVGRYIKRYDQFVLGGKPTFGIAPPPNIFAADLGEALVRGVLTGISVYGISGGASWLATHHIDWLDCISWGFIVGGTVVALPVAGEVLAEFMGDIAEGISAGWHRGQPEPDEPEPEPAPPPEPTEDEAGAARVPGAWWYRTRGGQLRCYYTPTNQKDRRPIISDQRMQAIFRLALSGTAFSADTIRAQVRGLSQPRFRILQRDWRKKVLYKLNEDNSGYLTTDGKIVAEAIVNTPLPQAR